MNDLQRHMLEVIKAHVEIGRDDIDAWVLATYPDMSAKSIGQNLRVLRDEGKIIEVEANVWQIAPTAPAPMTRGKESERRVLPPFHAKAKPVTVSISFGEEEIDDVIDLRYWKNGEENPVILTGNMRIMISGNTPLWHPAQRSIENVTYIEITQRVESRVVRYNVPKNHTVTIAPAE